MNDDYFDVNELKATLPEDTYERLILNMTLLQCCLGAPEYIDEAIKDYYAGKVVCSQKGATSNGGSVVFYESEVFGETIKFYHRQSK